MFPMRPIVFEVHARVSADHTLAFDKLIEDMNTVASNVGRASSVEVVAAEAGRSDMAARGISVTFADDADLANWLASTEHARFVTRLESMLVGPPRTQVRTGMEPWVPPSGARPPKRWKSAIATFVGLFPLLIVLRSVSDALRFDVLGPIATLALSVAISCVVMTWVVMPLLTKGLRGWLYD